MSEPFIDCPALHELKEGCPIRFARRVPKKIIMLETVRADFPFCGKTLKARIGGIYYCWTNSYGAVSAVLDDGQRLGVKPDEFQVEAWHPRTPLPPPHIEHKTVLFVTWLASGVRGF